MKAYKHKYDPYTKKVETIEFEVEEKPKTYVVTSKTFGVWASRIRKDEFGYFDSSNNSMYSFSPDATEYIKTFIDREKQRISILEIEILSHKENIENAQSFLNGGE